MNEVQHLKKTVAASYSGSTVNGDRRETSDKEIAPYGGKDFII